MDAREFDAAVAASQEDADTPPAAGARGARVFYSARCTLPPFPAFQLTPTDLNQSAQASGKENSRTLPIVPTDELPESLLNAS